MPILSLYLPAKKTRNDEIMKPFSLMHISDKEKCK